MDVSVIGLGNLGLALAVALSERGFRIVGVDNNPARLEYVQGGTWYDTLLPPDLRADGGSLKAQDTIGTAVLDTEATIILVQTPSDVLGRFLPDNVREVAEEVGRAIAVLDRYHLVVVSSTLMPSEMERVKTVIEAESGKRCGPDFGLVYVPEFVALGTTTRDFVQPDFVLIGHDDDEKAMSHAFDLYKQLTANDPPFYLTRTINAEIIKIMVNCYVTMKIAFANSIGELCERLLGSDADEVTRCISMDRRVSPFYFTAGTRAGGPCFPRDVGAARALCVREGIQPRLFDGLYHANEWANERVLWLALRAAAKAPNAIIGILGIAFKPGVHVETQSTGAYLVAATENSVHYCPSLRFGCPEASAQDVVDQASVIVVTTKEAEFRGLRFKPGQIVIDCWRWLDGDAVEAAGAEYVPLGRGRE